MKRFKIEQKNEILPIVFQWFSENQRALPWRVSYTPYEVWISEMMLQQTQMERGVEYYLRWMKRFPSVEDVARATLGDILQAWEGLGYYSRARNLHATAKIICEKYSGKIPCDGNLLLALPGIGEYTVAAIMGISFEKDFPTIDANVERVFSRLCDIESNNLKPIVKEEVAKIFSKGKARIFNQAWMEFGALICKKVPQCIHCPITMFCESYTLGVQNLRPIPKKRKDIIPVYASFCIIRHVDKGYLVRRRSSKGLWASMWEFIGVDSFILDNEQHEKNICQMNKMFNNNLLLLENALCEKPQKVKGTYPMTGELFYDLGQFVLIKELESIFNIKIRDNRKIVQYENTVENKQVEPKRIYTTPNEPQIETNEIPMKKNEVHALNVFPLAHCAYVKHSYTNHRLQALFYMWHIDYDFPLKENYKWVKDINSVAMPAHHRKAIEKI